ncbi:adenosine deaminase [Amycolatopsis sp. PS_44_ISF1]|uniref:adenosine deaminase n=1 Tax=Amycolatopsis sp. PS_44_ISF1 TaxID=2974917 RepID=UPI0028E00494|nr:adenosine deaminase [Amycolatopsis sp. PS_44_ISF1]MDT8914905.1 adenosine deaminase [Amycolatopsis sp. PS_44_ISF1]
MRELAALPKAHLHVHLESTVRPGTLRELADVHGVVLPDRTPVFDGFRAFADHNSLVRACLRRAEDFERVAREFCEDEFAQGTRYAEVTFTAASHGERLGDPDLPLTSVLKGLSEGGARTGLEWRVLLDHSRRRSVDRAERTLDLALRHEEVVGLGLAGEERHPLKPFAAVFDRAREAGLHLVHHAGEDAGPASIREALDLGHSERIGHGIRILEDPELVAEVRARGVALEVCPSSNVALGLVPSLAAHPLPRLVGAGLAVPLNTDVPSVTGTTLTGEFALARANFGYDHAALAAIAAAGVTASFAPEATKRALHQGIAAWLRPGAAG